MTATIFARWNGGASYSEPDFFDRETFPTIAKAVEALCNRRDSGHWQAQDFTYADRVDSALTPCVDESSYMDLYAGPDTDEMFMRLEFGPRGGVKRTRV